MPPDTPTRRRPVPWVLGRGVEQTIDREIEVVRKGTPALGASLSAEERDQARARLPVDADAVRRFAAAWENFTWTVAHLAVATKYPHEMLAHWVECLPSDLSVHVEMLTHEMPVSETDRAAAR